MFCIKFSERVVFGRFQCVKPGHATDFWKTRPDARTGAEKEDVSGETRTYGNPISDDVLFDVLQPCYHSAIYINILPWLWACSFLLNII